MKTYILTSSLLLIGTLIVSSCNDFLEEEPRNFLTPDQFYNTPGQATSAIIGIYDVLDNPEMYGQLGVISFGDGAADNLEGGTAASISINPLSYEVDAGNSRILDFYQSSYDLINRANAAIDRLTGSAIDETLASQLVGEAKFLRALSYFNLVRVFGDVVLRTTEAATLANLEQPRNPAAEVYAQIIQDLKDAASALPDEPLDIGRADAWAAKALLAKVYLTAVQPGDAVALTGEIVNSGAFSLVPEYNRLFRPGNNEVTEEIIFAAQFSAQRTNTLTNFITVSEVSAFGAFEPLEDVYTKDLYETGDLRQAQTVFDSILYQGKWIVPGIGLSYLKFAEEFYLDGVPESQTGTADYPILRYADVLLMHAEALTLSNGSPTPGAYDALNQVRARAGLSAVSGLNQGDFLNLLLRERRVEFVLEGHRWFDLKRLDKLEEAMQIFDGWQPHFRLFPIPESAMIANSKLTQNDGY